MSRSRIFVIAAAVLGGAGIVIGALAVTRGGSGASAPTAAETAQPTDAAGVGARGGVVLKRGKLSVEIVMTEKPGDARLVVYPFVDDKPATQGVTVSGTLVRYDRTHEPLRFDAAGQKFVSAQSIAKPHVFDATIDVKSGNDAASFPFARADGAIALTDAQLATSRIALAKAGPAQIATPFQLPGEIKFNEDRTAHV
ncbi:efflux transporter periplasmic adaptor subunit, partial [Burkholderia cenocepacia]|nr:efflux transporter periplasmic adaptor subunit [Burkholderia cenocepacia]